MNIRTLRLPLLAIAFVAGLVSCKKDFKGKSDAPKPLTPMSGSASATINIEEAYSRLPPTIMYNLADQVTLHLDKVQWRYETEYLMARIPLNEEENRSYLYAVKPYNDPTGPVRAYLVQFFHNSGSTQDDFSGKQMWLNLQDYSIYGVEYDHNNPVQFMDPIPINPYWESELYDAGLFYLDGSNKIAVYNNPQNPDTSATLLPWKSKDPKSRGNSLKCPDEGSHFFQNLMSGIGGVLLSIGEFLNSGSGGAAPPWHQSNGDEGFYGGADGYTPPPSPGGSNNPTQPPPPPPINIWDKAGSAPVWFETGETEGTSTPIYVNGSLLSEAVAGGTSVMTITNPTVTYLVGTLALTNNQATWLNQNMSTATQVMDFLTAYIPGLTHAQKVIQARNHIKLLMESPDYATFIGEYQQNNTGMWWVNETWLDPYGGLEFGIWAIDYLANHPTISLDYLLNNKNDFDDMQGEIDDYQNGNYDNTIYPQTDPNLPWPTIAPVIPTNQFVGWNTPGISRNCMSYAKAQIAEVGYQISSYYATGQTFQIYTAQNGVNNSMLIQGLSYIGYALSNGIPVIVGIDNRAGSSNPNTDNTTDHFVVIVGMGTNSTGKFLQFYDNADGLASYGTNSLNLLYYDSNTGYVEGVSKARYASNLTYRLTMIRKSKPL